MTGARHDPPLVEGAGGVVFNSRDEVLLIRQRDGSWVFPKGHIDPGEDPLVTAIREVEEEAGVIASCPDPDRRWITEYLNPRGQQRRITWYRLVTGTNVPVMREDQFPEGRFVASEQAFDLLGFREDRSLLRRILDEVAPA